MRTQVTPKAIRDWRLQHGLTQQKLARLLDVSSKQLHLWERGLASPAHPNMLALALRELDRWLEGKAGTRNAGPQRPAESEQPHSA